MKKPFYKVTNLFGEEEIRFYDQKAKSKKLFDDYAGFVDKFKPKKTSDDCFTSQGVYDIVLNYVKERCNITGLQVLRPFYPGGDYKSIEYPPDSVVVDNPPFSILAEIGRYYIDNNIKFFLFCPHLTAFSSDIDWTNIISSVDITYKNGAKVNTSFVSNMFGDIRVVVEPTLRGKIHALQKRSRLVLPKYKYPDNIITVGKLEYLAKNGAKMEIKKSELHHIREMDAQKTHKKNIFGSGFICSDRVAREVAKIVPDTSDEDTIVWELSEKERNIIKTLSLQDEC